MNYNPSHEKSLKFLTEPRRNNYFYGKLLDVPHLRMEQDYAKLKQWLLNRLTIGNGVLCGLGVALDQGKICVDPGVAIDFFGREIIVPGRFCIDPFAPKPPCEKGWGGPADEPEKPPQGPATLWLCYRECLTDFAPVAVSDCPPEDRCEAGTIVETFKFRIAQGSSPNSVVDKNFCTNILKVFPEQGGNPLGKGELGPQKGEAPKDPHEILCELIGKDCTLPDGDGCIPIATFDFLKNQRIGNLKVCAPRPRVYSNAVLLELIFCLMARLEECCGKQTADTLRITGVWLLGETENSREIPLKNPQQPLTTSVKDKICGLRIKFSKDVEQKSVTTASHINDVKRPNFLVTFVLKKKQIAVLGDLEFTETDTATYRFRQPLLRNNYMVQLYGDAAAPRRAMIDAKDQTRLDGETGLPSGDGREGGVFTFIIAVA